MAAFERRALIEQIQHAETELAAAVNTLDDGPASAPGCAAHAPLVRHHRAINRGLSVLLQCQGAQLSEAADRETQLRAAAWSVISDLALRAALVMAAAVAMFLGWRVLAH